MIPIQKLTSFKKTIWSYYKLNRRSMPWREQPTPYYVVVSEIMLQQTQVDRVIRKFESFIKKFPDWKTLARASTKEVLQEWSGLGYNRRALYLKRIAEIITKNGKYPAKLPSAYDALHELPGIGPNTAGSILAFAFNIPCSFIETNVRSVFIYFFFQNSRAKIPDSKLMPLIETCMSDPKIRKNPREWYYALMDYGSYLKKQVANPSRKSSHHIHQKPFKGSNRELRSRILKIIIQGDSTLDTISTQLKDITDQKQIRKNLGDLVKEGFIIADDIHYQIT